MIGLLFVYVFVYVWVLLFLATERVKVSSGIHVPGSDSSSHDAQQQGTNVGKKNYTLPRHADESCCNEPNARQRTLRSGRPENRCLKGKGYNKDGGEWRSSFGSK